MNKSYAQKAIEAVRGIPHDAKQAAKVCLWEFPESDLAAYQAMPDTPRLKSYGDYLAVLAAMQADLEGKGRVRSAREDTRGDDASGVGETQLAQ